MRFLSAVLCALAAACAFATACASAPDTPAEVPQAAAPPSSPRLVLGRPDGVARHRLTIVSDEGRTPTRLVAEFDVATRAGAAETVDLLSARRGPRDREAAPFPLPAGCAEAFGGGAGRLGRFELTPREDLSAFLPQCVPEPLFGAATDLYALLQVQTLAVTHAASLRRPGDRVEAPGFVARWSRPPSAHAVRVTAPSVALTLVELREDAAVLRWEPAPMRFEMVRTGPREGTFLLLDGEELLALEVTVDPRDGRLLGGRSLRDEVRATARFPWPSAELPPAGGPPPAGPGFPARVERELVLETLPR